MGAHATPLAEICLPSFLSFDRELTWCSAADTFLALVAPRRWTMTWTPPDHPNLLELLNSAVSDSRDGLHDQALTKFLWFHHNALRHNRSFVGVRLSYALNFWMELASVYAPARVAFIRTRDETEAAFRNDPTSFDLFHDLAALNEQLGDWARTADLFAGIARDDHAAAKRLYLVVEPHLIAAGRYEECGPFLDPPTRLHLAAHSYEVMRNMEESRQADEHPPPRLARTFYMHKVATLIGLLALNHRAEEADGIRAQALSVVDDEEFRELLGTAMTGHLPRPLSG
jgi:hypothetical protein